MSCYYANDDSQPVGPCTAEQIRLFYERGTIHENSWVIVEGGTEWRSFASLFLSPADDVENGSHRNQCASCGTENEREALFCAECGTKLECRNFQKTREPHHQKTCSGMHGTTDDSPSFNNRNQSTPPTPPHLSTTAGAVLVHPENQLHEKRQNEALDEIVAARRKQLQKQLIRSSVVFTISGAATILVFVHEISKAEPGGNGPGWMFPLIIGAGTAASFLSLLVALTSLFKLLSPVSRGAPSPDALLKKFYASALASPVEAEAMFSLHPDAIASIGGWRGFESHWNGVNGLIFQHLHEISAHKPNDFFLDMVKDVKPVANHGKRQRVQATISFFTLYTEVRTYENVKCRDGPWIYSAENEVIEESGRWYLADGQWAGRPA